MDTRKVTKEIVKFIKDYYKKNKLKGAVIGISGGKDSAVVAALFTKALGSENVVGLWMPCHSKESDKNDALLVSKTFGFPLKEVDLTKIYDEYVKEIKKPNKVSEDDLVNANINIKPRLRMMTLYYHAAMLSSVNKGVYLVPGTSNKCELYVGYFTKGGDNVSDINVLADLNVHEVIQVGEYLGVPDKVIHKTPDDGLSGLTDEDKLGVTYKDIAKVINNEKIEREVNLKITKMHQNNLHKFETPTYVRKQRLGIYMGSFNPPHKGHIKVVNYLINNNYVDKVLIVPTLNYWDKTDLIDINDRINMLKFFENEKIKVDQKHNKYIYTSELMRELSKEYDDELFLIIGADNIINFDKWKNYHELLKYKIIIMNRDNIDISKYTKKYKSNNFMVVDQYDYIKVSSTDIRKKIDEKYLDKRVLEYIKDNNLYRE